jgi:hypothetical protein
MSSPFVTVEVGGLKWTSPPENNTLNPIFRTTAEVKLAASVSANEEVLISLWSDAGMTKKGREPKFLGQVTLSLHAIPVMRPTDRLNGLSC